MKRILAITSLLVALFTGNVKGQGTVTVTGTATDPSGTAWANGTYSASYVIPPGAGSLTNKVTSQTISPTVLNGTLDASGAFSITLVSTANVLPAISGVTFKICPQMTNSPCYTTVPILIGTTSPQSVSSQISLVLQNPSVTGAPLAQAYNDAEVSAVLGNQYVRLSDSTFRCYTTSWGACGGGGGSGTVNAGTAGQIAYYPGSAAAVSGNVATADSSGNVKTTSATAQKVVFFDNFQYADGPIAGQVAPTGQTWQVTGTQAANAQIVSHTLQYSPRTISGPLAFYANIPNLGVKIYSYSITFTVNANPGGSGSPDSSCFVGASIVGDPSNITNKMIHMGASCNAFAITWWNGASQNNPPAYCSNLNFSSALTVGNTYTITETWDGANNVSVIGPHGESIQCTDSNFATVGGNGFFAEFAYNTTDYAFPTISNITVTSQGGAGVVADSVKSPFITGCLGCGAGGLGVAYLSNLGIGTQTPTVPLTLIVPLSSSSDAALIDASTSSANARLRLKSQSSGFDPGIIFDENVANPTLLYSCAAGNYLCIDTQGTSTAYSFQAGNFIESTSTIGANLQVKSTLNNSSGVGDLYLDRGNAGSRSSIHFRTSGTDFFVEGMNTNTAWSLTDSTNGHAIVSFPNNTMPAGAYGGNATGALLGGLTTMTALASAGTKFTTTGCSVSATTGGATAGKMTLGANSCTVVVTLNGATGVTAPNGWSCWHNDETTAAGNTASTQTSNATTASFVIPATAGTTDVINFGCMAF